MLPLDILPGTLVAAPFLGALARAVRPAAPSEAALRILACVRRKPGLGLSELQRESGVGWASLYLHLETLRAARLVRSVNVGRRRYVYDAAAGVPPRHEVAFPRHGTGARVARAIADTPGISVRALTEQLALSQRVVYYHVSRLDEGRYLKARRWRGRGLFPSERFLDALARESARP
ncbi:MAG TPA: hypothetical protein VM889_06100 [Candidatus Thermoplasmatota archaeon]|nr:hypothetical protein [Candidatus Thermoplasmatota archaeon]